MKIFNSLKSLKFNAIPSALISIITGLIVGGLANHYKELNFIDSFLGGIFVATITEIFLLSHAHFPKIQDIVDDTNKKLKTTEEFIEILLNNRSYVDKIITDLNSSNNFMKNMGKQLFDVYLKGFKVLPNGGIHVEGQENTLKLYRKFWYLLAEEQEKRKKENRDPIIARVTHSNDISIWETNVNPIIHEIFSFQKNFIDKGGSIIRFIIGKYETEEEDKKYKNVINSMRKQGIEVYYFSYSEVNETDYDYLFLADQKIILKWLSGQHGKKISAFELTDNIDDEILFQWEALYEKAQEKTPKSIIPVEKQIGLIIEPPKTENLEK